MSTESDTPIHDTIADLERVGEWLTLHGHPDRAKTLRAGAATMRRLYDLALDTAVNRLQARGREATALEAGPLDQSPQKSGERSH